MQLSRIRRMSLAEIACRGRQQTSKWLERVDPRVGRRVSAGQRRSAAAARALERFQAARAPKLFDPAVVPEIARRWPASATGLIAAADRVCAGRFSLLGYDGLVFGAPVDWHLDPIWSRRAPHAHWSRVRPLDPDAVGDSKIVWELNRHQWLVTLAQAWQLTGDPRYVERAAALLDSWLRANPRGQGINWSSSLEVAYRLIAWCWALAFLQSSPAATRPPFAKLGLAIREHALHIERYLSHYFSPNTHLTGEALGLLYAGVLFDGLPEAARWREQGRQILIDESERQILPDGVHFEQATCYHRYTIEIYGHALLLGERFGLVWPSSLRARLGRMADVLAHLAGPDGTMPHIGDADGGWLLPFVRRDPQDSRGVFGWLAAALARGELAWLAGGDAPEVGWALGLDGLAQLDRLSPKPPERPASRLFASGGYAVMQSGWQRHASSLIVDVGPLGCPISAAHGHADALSLQCRALGEEWIADTGTYSYTPEPRWRDYFRSTAAHSTVVVDGVSQAEPAGPFSWHTRPTVRVREWRTSRDYDLVDAEHDGYMRLGDPVRHRRRVLFVKPSYWVVVDDLIGKDEHTVELRFQLTTGPALHGLAACARRGSAALWIVPASSAALEAVVREGAQEPLDGWRSPAYGRREAAPVLIYRMRTRLPLRVATLLMPSGRADACPSVVPIHSHANGPIAGLWLIDRQERVVFDHRQLVHEAITCAES
jgi:hypothetical protein